MHKVMVHPAEYDDCFDAVERAFKLFPLEIEGKKVMVKPNALNGASPEEGVTTHPSVLSAVIERLEKSGAAEVVVGDNPGARSYGANEETFRKCGLLEAAKEYYQNIGTSASEVELSSRFFNKLSVSKAILDADIYISLPKFKTHGLTIVTAAVKNNYGILPGGQKLKGHRIAGDPLNFNELVVDVFGLRVPDLFIVDAVVGMEGNGPASVDLRHIGKIMASDNAVALDATISRMMGFNPASLRFIQVAKERGYGDYEKERIEIIGEFSPIPDFKLPPSAEGRGEGGSAAFRERMERQAQMRPKVDEALCTGCETCVENCPVSALSMVRGLPKMDPDKCIVCYCCQENCPEKAIQLC